MRKRIRFVVLTGAAALSVSLIVAAQQTATTPGVHPVSGRRYAQPMSYLGADWLDRSERVSEEEPDIALDAIKLVKGSTVADVGAGSGYMTEKLAAQVGPTGRVYANDMQPEMLRLLGGRLAARRITNVTLVQGAVDNPKLPASAIDLELLVDVYHEFSEPQVMLRHLREALKVDGRLVLLEYRKEDPNVPIRLEHKMSVADAKLEVEDEQFQLVDVDERLPRQHILIFTRRDR